MQRYAKAERPSHVPALSVCCFALLFRDAAEEPELRGRVPGTQAPGNFRPQATNPFAQINKNPKAKPGWRKTLQI